MLTKPLLFLAIPCTLGLLWGANIAPATINPQPQPAPTDVSQTVSQTVSQPDHFEFAQNRGIPGRRSGAGSR